MSYRDPVKQKENSKEYYEKNKETINGKHKEYYETNKEKISEIQKEYYENNKEKKKEKQKEYYDNNKEKKKECTAKRLEDRKQHAYDSITSNEIINQYQWDMWCKEIKRRAKYNKQPYSDNFANDIMFEMMLQGCFYCGDIATTIDRIDSTLNHSLENCVGCCNGCNMSKGAADSATFIRKACYRVCGEYVDQDTDIWFVHKNKPGMAQYKYNAKKKGVPFELSNTDFDTLVKGDCAYCKRSPISWFGVDRMVPSKGYVIGNVASCCLDCNVDKLEDDIDVMMARNKRIVNRVIVGELVIPKCEKVILHKNHRKRVELV